MKKIILYFEIESVKEMLQKDMEIFEKEQLSLVRKPLNYSYSFIKEFTKCVHLLSLKYGIY